MIVGRVETHYNLANIYYQWHELKVDEYLRKP